jgi:hypothetical protein
MKEGYVCCLSFNLLKLAFKSLASRLFQSLSALLFCNKDDQTVPNYFHLAICREHISKLTNTSFTIISNKSHFLFSEPPCISETPLCIQQSCSKLPDAPATFVDRTRIELMCFMEKGRLEFSEIVDSEHPRAPKVLFFFF